jgi:hypothetical protein
MTISLMGIPMAKAVFQMLIREEENFSCASEGPLECSASVGRGADKASSLAAEGFDGSGGVHVGEGDHVAGQACSFERVPAVLDLPDLGHVGHRTTGVEVGQDHLLPGLAQNVGGLRHEMHAAE